MNPFIYELKSNDTIITEQQKINDNIVLMLKNLYSNPSNFNLKELINYNLQI